jgi:peptidoglycan/xylan/chitin deacetylase (PgdA/CDA1 family)
MNKFIALMYHKLEDRPRGSYSITESEFKSQINWLKDEGFTIEGFAGLEKRLKENKFPDRYVVVTFDDGQKSDLRAAEILCEAGAQATFFLVKDLSQTKKNFLKEDEIKELAKLCSVGSHGVTHSPLSKMSPDQIKSELADSKKWLEDLTGDDIRAFSAPGGFITTSIVNQAVEMGYSLLGNSIEWWNYAPRTADKKIVNRIALRNTFTLSTLRKIVSGETSFFLRRRLRSNLLAIPKKLLSEDQVRRLLRLY